MPQGTLRGRTALLDACAKGIRGEVGELLVRQGCRIWVACQPADAESGAPASLLAAGIGGTITPLDFDFAMPDEAQAFNDVSGGLARVDRG